MKKNIIYVVLIAVIAIVVLVPGIRNFLKDQFFPIATIENSVHISEEDYDIDLKGINAPSTNLKTFKDKPVFLNFWEPGARHAEKNGRLFKNCTIPEKAM